ncbi:thioredoxin family protein [bacterium]|nr:thioredoxin family protein [bacterium]
MVLLESLNLTLGTTMTSFSLDDPFGVSHDTSTLMGEKGLVIIFTCNHCPYAIAIWDRLIKAAHTYAKLGINIVAINPNINPDYPDDSPEAMTLKIQSDQIPFPYLVDDTQDIARQYSAQCTPDLYLLDTEMSLIYHGRFDDNWQFPDQVSTHDLTHAVRSLSSQTSIDEHQVPSMGCSIKWVS